MRLRSQPGVPPRRTRFALRASVVTLAVAALAGCGSGAYKDLEDFVKQSGQGLRGKVEPLPEVKAYQAFVYAAVDQPDPFKPRKLTPKFAAGELQPDATRRKEILESFPLEQLKMVGTLEKKGRMIAVVRSPDNNLVQIKPGDHMGQNFGKVLAVTESEIKLKELVQDPAGQWGERETTLPLTEEAEDKQQAAKK